MDWILIRKPVLIEHLAVFINTTIGILNAIAADVRIDKWLSSAVHSSVGVSSVCATMCVIWSNHNGCWSDAALVLSTAVQCRSYMYQVDPLLVPSPVLLSCILKGALYVRMCHNVSSGQIITTAGLMHFRQGLIPPSRSNSIIVSVHCREEGCISQCIPTRGSVRPFSQH